MQTLNFDNQVIWFDESLISAEQVKYAFDAEYWQQQDRIIGSATGRGTTWFIELDSVQAALRHYRRGGLFGKIVQDSYFFLGIEKTRSFLELKLLQRLNEAGVNVPRPIAARVLKRSLTYQADLLSEKVSNAQDLVAILEQRSLTDCEYRKVGVEIRKMHLAGVNHTDLNIHNILIDSNNEVWVIDFDKCIIDHGGSYDKSNLSRLLRSFRKERKKRNIRWKEENFSSLIRGYNEHV